MTQKARAKKGNSPATPTKYNEEFKRNAVDMYLKSVKTEGEVDVASASSGNRTRVRKPLKV